MTDREPIGASAASQPDDAPKGPQRVAVVICARDAQEYIASTVRSCRAIPRVDLILVVDDGSEDDTARNARLAGAVVVRHSLPRGRASAMETGVKVVAMRDRADWPPRLLLFLRPDLGESAVEATALVEAVIAGDADCACGMPADASQKPLKSTEERIARRAIERSTGWSPVSPLSPYRCMTREAVDAVMPFAPGLGLWPAMTIDLLVAGLSIVEVPCSFHAQAGFRSSVRARLSRKRDVYMASMSRRWARVKLASAHWGNGEVVTAVGKPFPEPARDREGSKPRGGTRND